MWRGNVWEVLLNADCIGKHGYLHNVEHNLHYTERSTVLVDSNALVPESTTVAIKSTTNLNQDLLHAPLGSRHSVQRLSKGGHQSSGTPCFGRRSLSTKDAIQVETNNVTKHQITLFAMQFHCSLPEGQFLLHYSVLHAISKWQFHFEQQIIINNKYHPSCHKDVSRLSIPHALPRQQSLHLTAALSAAPCGCHWLNWLGARCGAVSYAGLLRLFWQQLARPCLSCFCNSTQWVHTP